MIDELILDGTSSSDNYTYKLFNDSEIIKELCLRLKRAEIDIFNLSREIDDLKAIIHS